MLCTKWISFMVLCVPISLFAAFDTPKEAVQNELNLIAAAVQNHDVDTFNQLGSGLGIKPWQCNRNWSLWGAKIQDLDTFRNALFARATDSSLVTVPSEALLVTSDTSLYSPALEGYLCYASYGMNFQNESGEVQMVHMNGYFVLTKIDSTYSVSRWLENSSSFL